MTPKPYRLSITIVIDLPNMNVLPHEVTEYFVGKATPSMEVVTYSCTVVPREVQQ